MSKPKAINAVPADVAALYRGARRAIWLTTLVFIFLLALALAGGLFSLLHHYLLGGYVAIGMEVLLVILVGRSFRTRLSL